ncbi:PREDICTED: acyl-CoA dehydrogenase family member 11-like [Priapulus caudatus]|uniref:Acyl-CoA dehydrogenase family member 11-like n=1 Tax=Priapulus caudatus TaxID=37621 RepID=A0ABM1EVC2_PRICU|nr:PREDICTED: acyl-CoA dehydrogenase family member 11-like [Priapulus caudatus]
MFSCSILRYYLRYGTKSWKTLTTVGPSSTPTVENEAQPTSDVKMPDDSIAVSKQTPGGFPFATARIGPFFQEQPTLHNPFKDDQYLQRYLQRVLPPEVHRDVVADLDRFGRRVVAEIDALGRECETQPPSLRRYAAWGRRTDDVATCAAWRRQHAVAAEEGLVAAAYERSHGAWSRLHQLAKLYLYAPSSGLYSCPLAMTDGAAKLVETAGRPASLERAFERLTSRDPARFWTSGQWMTERQGGSDVGTGTETLAKPHRDGSFRLYGYKWFTSATDANMAFTLARVADADDRPKQKGSKGLSLFYLETRDESGKLNNITVERLKDKLGTRQLPTAELILDGAVAHKVGEEGSGVLGIVPMLTITRLHNSVSAVAGMRRMISLSRDYSTKRTAFGKLICDHPLHMQTLARLEVETRGAFLLVMEVGRLLGLDDVGGASDHDMLMLRILTPLVKLYTAKQAMKVASEGLESFGGQGFMEDTGLPTLFRDAQVLSIWEGTTNVLSLDVLRCLMKSRGSTLHAFMDDIHARLEPAREVEALREACSTVDMAAQGSIDFAHGHMDELTTAARDFSFSLARAYIGALLLEAAASKSATNSDVLTAQRWCDKRLDLVGNGNRRGAYRVDSTKAERELVMEGHPTTSKL